MSSVSRLPFLFIATGLFGFVLFHATSLLSLTGWLGEGIRGPAGWFQTHLFVLGWATMLAMGAVYQLIHVILQSVVFSERLGYLHYLLFTVGLFGLLFGFVQGDILWIAGFATLAFAGILLFSVNLAITLYRSAKWNSITLSTAFALFYLLVTGLTGLSMGIDFGTGWLGDAHENFFHAHIWLGTLGWFGSLITGFSYKLLPMFYLSHDYKTRLQYVTFALWNTGVLSGAVLFLAGADLLAVRLSLPLIATAMLIYNVHLWQIRSKRHKRNPGVGIAWSVRGNQLFALFALAMTIKLWFAPELIQSEKTLLIIGWTYLSGWVSFMVLCYASKIIPFLWWTHKYGKRVGKPGTPVMADLLNERRAGLGLASIATTTLAVMAGLALESQPIVMIAGILFSLVSIGYISLVALVFSR